MDSFWSRAEGMVKAVIVFWPVRARLDLAGRLDKLASEIRQSAMDAMGSPSPSSPSSPSSPGGVPFVDTSGFSVGGGIKR